MLLLSWFSLFSVFILSHSTEYNESDAYYALRCSGYAYTQEDLSFPITLPDTIKNITWVKKAYNDTFIVPFHAYTALDEENRRIIVAFKGLSDLQQIYHARKLIYMVPFNFTTNVTSKSETLGNKCNCTAQDIEIMYLFSVYWKLIKNEIIHNIRVLMDICKQCVLWFSGHSAGGALASVAAFDITLSFNIDANISSIYTFGEPRTGNWYYAHCFNALFPQHSWRIVHQRDAVPHLIACQHEKYIFRGECSKSVVSAYHHGREIVYSGDSFCDYQQCNPTGEDLTCSDGNYFYDFIPNMMNLMNNAHSKYWKIIENGGFCPEFNATDNYYSQIMSYVSNKVSAINDKLVASQTYIFGNITFWH